MQVIKVNGVEYVERYKRKSRTSGRMMGLIMMAGMMSGDTSLLSGLGGGKRTLLHELIEEYGLIMQKKSELSSNRRQIIKNQFENQFKKLSDYKMYKHLYGKHVQVNDSVGNVMIWDKKWDWINEGQFIPTEITEEQYEKELKRIEELKNEQYGKGD